MKNEMRYVQTASEIVGPFLKQADAEDYVAEHGGDLVDPILSPDGGTKITPPPIKWRRRFVVRGNSVDGWTVHPQPPMPATSTFLTGGWAEIEKLRKDMDAVDHFPSTDDYNAFCREFGGPPEVSD